MKQFLEKIDVIREARSFVGRIKDFTISPDSIARHGRAIYEAYLDQKVLVFENQNISPGTFAEFGKIFGEPEQHHVIKLRHPDEPTLTFISNQSEKGRNEEMKYSGDGWHSDYSYKLIPSNATMLHGIEIPDSGGDTLFADAEAAFQDLPNARKNELRKLRVRHQYRWSPDKKDPWARWKYIGPEERAKTPEITHPLVRVHPDTGRETLFIQPRVIGSVVAIAGLPEDESTSLIQELIDLITDEKYCYRHKWSPLDVVVWDNRCILHSATTKGMDERQVRRLLRLTTHGSAVTPSSPDVGYSQLSRLQAAE